MIKPIYMPMLKLLVPANNLACAVYVKRQEFEPYRQYYEK